MAKKTQEQISKSKQADQKAGEANAAAGKTQAASQTIMGKTTGASTQVFAEGSPLDILLFGWRKGGNMGQSMTAYGATASSDQTSVNQFAHVVPALRFLIKNVKFTTF